jgi:tRNA dimethylallyltransferase
VVSLFLIAGPTAVGKSEIAVAVAERCGGEIVGADAFQIYAGLELLTAKPSAELRARVPHHLVGTVPLTQRCDVAQYLVEAQRCIADIRARGRMPMVCGGTGLYVRALTHGLAALPPADAALREDLERRPIEELQGQFAELDPQGAARLDLKNPRRVIRALEVCLLTGRPFSSFREQWATPPAGVRGVFLMRDRDELYARIEARTEAMFAAGVVEEVRTAGAIGPTAEQTLGLREIRALLAGEMDRAACIAAIQQATRRYAKRQLTWFRREPGVAPMNLTGRRDSAVAAEIAALVGS